MSIFKPGLYPRKHELTIEEEFDRTLIKDLLHMQGRYGTRSTSALSIKSSGEVNFFERYLDKDQRKEQTVSYQI